MKNYLEKAQETLATLPLQDLAAAGIYKAHEPHRLLCSRPSSRELQGLPPRMEEIAHGQGFEGVLYTHIPFCEKICGFCPYVQEPLAKAIRERTVDRYLPALERELSSWKERFGTLRATALYTGGGTPSALSGPQIGRLFRSIREHASVDSAAEVTFEVAPVSLQRGPQALERLSAMRDGGVNRVSMGVQSTDEAVLKAAERVNTRQMVRDAYGRIREAGFANVNIDLIYGLPHQSVESFLQDLEEVVALDPESITTYRLRIEEGTPFESLSGTQPGVFPGRGQTLLMKIAATGLLADAGYEQSPTDWFYKRNGRHIAQHQKWQDGGSLLGTGVAAYSSLSSGWVFGNVGVKATDAGALPASSSASITEYIRRMEAGEQAIEQGHLQAADELMQAYVQRALKTGVPLGRFRERFGSALEERFPGAGRLQGLGLAAVEDGVLRLTALGNLFAEEAAAALVR